MVISRQVGEYCTVKCFNDKTKLFNGNCNKLTCTCNACRKNDTNLLYLATL